jgi:nucleoid-associated protein YgaU
MSILDQTAASGSAVLDPIAAQIKNPFQKAVPPGKTRGNDFPAGFTITEYVNGVPQTNTAIRLVGNMMPMQPFQWGGELRAPKEYYPGNPEPNTQILGPKESDLTIKGRFKDKRYKDTSMYGAAYDYASALEELRKRGNLLKFGMHGSAGDWFRFGFLEKTDFKMNKLSWIDYELTFSVVSDKQPINDYFAAPEKSAPSAVNQDLLNKAAAFQSTYSAVPATIPQSLADVVTSIVSGVATNVALVTNFVGTLIQSASDLKASANRALGLIASVRAQLSVWQRQIGAIGTGFVSLSSQGNAVGQFADVFFNLQHLQEMRASMHEVNATLARMQRQFDSIAQTIPIARYRVVDGDTLQNISVRFYGDVQFWQNIYDHNRLASTQLTQGQILEIPHL